MLFLEHFYRCFIFLYILIIFIFCFWLVPTGDAFYYWDWSRQLALGYFDGSPMIAYLLASSTGLFGNTIFAISFVGFASTLGMGFFIYAIGKELYNKETAYLSIILFFISPIFFGNNYVRVIYDTAQHLFWAASLFFMVRYVKFANYKYIYYLAIALGLLLLSKYTGIVLIICILLYLIFTPEKRVIFNNKHFYFSIILLVIIFSPVIIWNYQNNWISFNYQLFDHTTTARAVSHLGTIAKFWFALIANFNFLLFIAVYCYLYRRKSRIVANPEVFRFLLVISVLFVLFWALTSIKFAAKSNWLDSLTISLVPLAAYGLQQFKWRRLAITIFIIYSLACIGFLLANSFLVSYTTKGAQINLAKQSADFLLQQPQVPIFANGYNTASRTVFWLPNKPYIYALPCGNKPNQYGIWSRKIDKQVAAGKVPAIEYLSFSPGMSCINKYFTCTLKKKLTYKKPRLFTTTEKYNLFLYNCKRKAVTK